MSFLLHIVQYVRIFQCILIIIIIPHNISIVKFLYVQLSSCKIKISSTLYKYNKLGVEDWTWLDNFIFHIQYAVIKSFWHSSKNSCISLAVLFLFVSLGGRLTNIVELTITLDIIIIYDYSFYNFIVSSLNKNKISVVMCTNYNNAFMILLL